MSRGGLRGETGRAERGGLPWLSQTPQVSSSSGIGITSGLDGRWAGVRTTSDARDRGGGVRERRLSR